MSDQIRNALRRADNCKRDADKLGKARTLLEKYAYFGDSHGDPAEDAEMVQAIAALDKAIAKVKVAARNIAAQAKAMPGYQEYLDSAVEEALDGFGL